MQDPEVWFNSSQQYLPDGQPKGNSTYDYIYDTLSTYLLMSPQSYLTVVNNTELSEEERQKIIGGASFDANNQSTAKVAYTVVDYADNYFLYNFNLFYPWNGKLKRIIR